MSHCKTIVSTFSAFFLMGVLVSSQGIAEAQPESLTIDPSTGVAPAPPQPATAAEAPQVAGNEGSASADNMFYGDYLEDVDIDDTDRQHTGTVPTTHTVVTGDTLWDLSAYYFSNAWNWPKIWKQNPEITDPHWIYPGNIIRLREGGDGEPVATSLKPTGELSMGGPGISTGGGYGLRQTAYVDLKDLKDAGTVAGSIDEKALLATGDSIYVSYGDTVPEVGTTLAIYGPGTKIKRDGKQVGAYIEVAGELRITFAEKDKRARAVITRSVNPVERGMRVGPLELNFKDTKPVASDKKVDGRVAGLIGPDELIGAEAAVIIDRGSEDGVQVGNRFLVVRRGDGYRKVMKPGTNVGQDDENYPARAIGEIIVVQAGEKACLGVVTFSIHEFGIGDRVFMRKGQ